MGACEARAGVDDEEVQLRGCCKNADSEIRDRWQVEALSARLAQDLENPEGSEAVAAIDAHDAKKDAMAILVQSFVKGRDLEVSSMQGAGMFLVSLNPDLSEMSLEELPETSTSRRKLTIPLIYVLNASIDNSPGLQRYSLSSTLRIRIGSHSGHGPDTMLLQLESHSECSAMALLLCASSRHLQKVAGWERKRLMDDESVATTMIRSVQKLKDPQGLAPLILSTQTKRREDSQP